jgi:cell wall-associated NlpC family hydrolase
VFYSKDTDGDDKDDYVYHVGIYVYPGKTLHTYRPGIGVTYSAFKPGDYWYNICDFGRRVL